MRVSPGVDSIRALGPPEKFAQVLCDTLPQDVAGALALLTAAHHELIQVRSAAVHALHGDDGCCSVADDTRNTESQGGLEHSLYVV